MTPNYDALGAAIRTAREARGMSCTDVGNRICELYPEAEYDPAMMPAWVQLSEHDPAGMLDHGMVAELAAGIGVSSQEADRWHALAGLVSPDLLEALCANPGAWDVVRATLAGGV